MKTSGSCRGEVSSPLSMKPRLQDWGYVRLDEVSLDWAGKPGPYNLMAAEEMTFHFPVGVGFKPAPSV